MINQDLTLDWQTGTKVFALRSLVDGKSVRSDLAATPGLPFLLTVSHSLRNPKDPKSPTRHLVRFDRTKANALGDPVVCSIYAVMEVPSDGTFTLGDLGDLKNVLQSFFLKDSSAIFSRWINAEP